MKSKIFRGLLGLVAIAAVAVVTQSYASSEASSAQDRNRTFVKTSYRCKKSNCSCSGYWGYKHRNGTYEGACSNTDGHGHRCGHGPEQHGLRKW